LNVLALYDIHGNIDALEAVLADPRATDADVVVVGGDAVPGPFARATLARLEALSGPVRWIRGNGEREVADAVGGSAPADDDLAARTAAITAAEIGDDQARALGELHSHLRLALGGSRAWIQRSSWRSSVSPAQPSWLHRIRRGLLSARYQGDAHGRQSGALRLCSRDQQGEAFIELRKQALRARRLRV
jgi:hypothetical protein